MQVDLGIRTPTLRAHHRWKRFLTMVTIAMVHASTGLISQSLELMRDRKEKEAYAKYTAIAGIRAKSGSAAKEKPSKPMLRPPGAKGKKLSRSTAKKWMTEPDDCCHVEMSPIRGGPNNTHWITCLTCGTRWDWVYGTMTPVTSGSAATDALMAMALEDPPLCMPCQKTMQAVMQRSPQSASSNVSTSESFWGCPTVSCTQVFPIWMTKTKQRMQLQRTSQSFQQYDISQSGSAQSCATEEEFVNVEDPRVKMLRDTFLMFKQQGLTEEQAIQQIFAQAAPQEQHLVQQWVAERIAESSL